MSVATLDLPPAAADGTQAMTSPAIETDALCCDFRGHRAVDNLTLRIPVGSVFGLLGPNGAGKTTTIRLLLGLLEASSGKAQVLGFDTRTQSDAIRERTGALLEHTGLYERLSAEANLEFYGRVWRLPRTERRARIHGLLTRLGLWERRGDTVATWSRGMKQKLAIARAMLHRPRLLFLDEPTAGLDPLAAAALRDDLAALVSRERVTVFLTTHNLAEAESLCGSLAVLRNGRLLATGSPGEVRAGSRRAHVDILGRGYTPEIVGAVRRRPEVASVNLAGSGGLLAVELRPGADVAGLVALIVGQGGEVEGVHRGQDSLDDAFRALMSEAS